MQMRVARLCLDCEELHTDNSCPRCASESYAFLSTWLQVEERRRWRRPKATVAATSEGPWWSEHPLALVRSFGRWWGARPVVSASGPATRAADRVAQMNFDKHEATSTQSEAPVAKPQVRKA